MGGNEDHRPVAVVTGAARGIGKGCAEALGRRGFELVLVDVLEDELAATVEGFGRGGVAARGFIADVADHHRAREVAGEVLERRAAIDVLVNNAGTPMPKGLLEIEEHEWDRTIDVHMKGCFNWCRAVAPSMLARGAGGASSTSLRLSANSGGVTSAVSKFAYAGAKAGILGMTRALAKELGPWVSVNAICPGAIKTEITASMLEARRRSSSAVSASAGSARRRTSARWPRSSPRWSRTTSPGRRSPSTDSSGRLERSG